MLFKIYFIFSPGKVLTEISIMVGEGEPDLNCAFFSLPRYVREVAIPNDSVQKQKQKEKTHINRQLNIKFLNNGFIF